MSPSRTKPPQNRSISDLHPFGFTWEGHFGCAVIVRGRTRDTAWFSMIDEEWPALKAALAARADIRTGDHALGAGR